MKKFILVSTCLLFISSAVFSQDDTYYTDDQSSVAVQSQEAPPALPDYVQPPCPADGYIWTPGYWAWGPTGYYWVAGVWVLPPQPGLLWTPGYWGFYGNYYGWHPGYWGAEVGYYGGINYGFGYYGAGFCGGRWLNGIFNYNTAVWHIDMRISNHIYASREGIRVVSHGASFNGPNGVHYRPAPVEMNVMRANNHIPPTQRQVNHANHFANEGGQFFHNNNGVPATHTMNKPAPGGQRFNESGGRVSAPRGSSAPRPNAGSAPRGGGNGAGAPHGGGGGARGGRR